MRLFLASSKRLIAFCEYRFKFDFPIVIASLFLAVNFDACCARRS